MQTAQDLKTKLLAIESQVAGLKQTFDALKAGQVSPAEQAALNDAGVIVDLLASELASISA